LPAAPGLPDPPAFYFAGFKSDWKQRKEQHNITRYAQCTLVCEHCLATRKPGLNTYADFSDNPGWAATEMTHTEYLASTTNLSPWWNSMLDVGFSKERHHWDGMHLLYKAGCVSDLVGSMLIEWCEVERVVTDPEANTVDLQLQFLFQEFLQWAHHHKFAIHRVAHWTSGRLKRQSQRHYPYVTDHYKCGDVKAMMLWVAAVTAQALNKKVAAGVIPSEYERMRAACICAIASYARGLSAAGPLLEDAERLALADHLRTFLRCYSYLSNINQHLGRCLYGLRPKWHGIHHIMRKLLFDLENPRTHEVWGEETLAGYTARLTRKSHPRTAMLRVCEKYAGALIADL